MAKKENNRRNHSARERWTAAKKQGRHKQVWVHVWRNLNLDEIEALSLEELNALPRDHWEKVA